MSNLSASNDSNVEVIIEPRKNDTNKIYPGRVIQPTQTTRSVNIQCVLQILLVLINRSKSQSLFIKTHPISNHTITPVHQTMSSKPSHGYWPMDQLLDGPTGPRGHRGCPGMVVFRVRRTYWT